MEPQVEVEGFISKVETVYGIVASFHVQMQSFYIFRIGMERFQHILPGWKGS